MGENSARGARYALEGELLRGPAFRFALCED